VNRSIGLSLYSDGKDRSARKGSSGAQAKERSRVKDFRLADEIAYIQNRAAEHDGRFVTVGPLILFSTDTFDAWLLDPAGRLAARLARDGDPEAIYFEETDANFAIGWKGNYRIQNDAFVYIDKDSGRMTTILGYPTDRLAQLA
jgi:hypothetical protein